MSTVLERKSHSEILKTSSQFFFHKDKIEQELAKSILWLGDKTKLRDACEYALTNGGKRFRPLIVLLIAEALGQGLSVYESALAVEFFHTASLIVDDLPCMDNDDERRNKPSLHKVYGESIAILASYSLMTAGFEKIRKNAALMKDAGPLYSSFSDKAGMIALECATRCAGILGATGGQFLDLFPPQYNLDAAKEIIYKKTVTLFEISFVFGWVFGGGDISLLDKVKKASYHIGMAFQIADDIGDLIQDEKKQKEISMARIVGKERSLLLFNEEMDSFHRLMRELGLDTPSFDKMSEMLVKLAISNASLS